MRFVFSIAIGVHAAVLCGCSERTYSLGTVLGDAGAADTRASVEGGDWLFSFGSEKGDRVRALQVSDDGRVFITGEQEIAEKNAYRPDVIVAALSARGTLQWFEPLGHRDRGWLDRAAGVEFSPPGRIAVVGHYGVNGHEYVPFIDIFPLSGGPPESSAVLFGNRLCPGGELCSQQGSQEIARVVADGAGRLMLAGVLREDTYVPLPWLQQPVPAGRSGWGLLLRLDGMVPRWGRTFGDLAIRHCADVAFDGAEVVAVCLGQGLTAQDDDRTSRLVVMRLRDGAVIANTRTLHTSGELFDARLVRTSSGDLVVMAAFSGELVVDQATVSARSTRDIALLGMRPDLTMGFVRHLAGDGQDHGLALAAAGGDGVLLASGLAFAPVEVADGAPAPGPFVTALSAAGTFSGWTVLPSEGRAQVHAVASRAVSGQALVAGGFTGRLGIPAGDSQFSAGGEDAFVAAISLGR